MPYSYSGLSFGQRCSRGNAPAFDPDLAASYNGFTSTNSLQALVPAYEFDCSALLTRLHAGVAGGQTREARIVFQIWRPQGGGGYSIVADLIYPGAMASRNTNMVTITPLTIGIPVQPGDVLGFFLENDGEEREEDLLELLYDTMAGTTTYFLQGTGRPLCNFSTCANSVQAMRNTAPLISVVLGESHTQATPQLKAYHGIKPQRHSVTKVIVFPPPNWLPFYHIHIKLNTGWSL